MAMVGYIYIYIYHTSVHAYTSIGGFKFGDLVAHRQTAKLNVSPIFSVFTVCINGSSINGR